MFQKESENILAFNELKEKEAKMRSQRQLNKDSSGLTSQHHMGMEAIIRKIKVILQEKRERRAAIARKK